MLDRIYYTLTEAEEILQTSREGLKRLERASLLVIHGENHGKRVTGISLRALEDRIAKGEDIWAVVKASEDRERSEAKLTAKGQSTRTKGEHGGTNPRPRVDSESLASAPLVNKAPGWLKKST